MRTKNGIGVEQAARQLQTLNDLPGSALTKYAAALKRVSDKMDRANEVLATMPEGARRNLFRRDGVLAAEFGERITLKVGETPGVGDTEECFDSLDLEWHEGALTAMARRRDVYLLERPLRMPFERKAFLETLANEPKVVAALNTRLAMLVTGIREELRSLEEVAGSVGGKD